jgi:hypothetical protein
MLLDEVVQRFTQSSPVAVMVRATLKHALDAQPLDQLFDDHAESGYTRHLLFSSVVDLMALVVCRVHRSVRSAYRAAADRLPVTLAAVYQKLNGLEPAVCAALVRHNADALRPVLQRLGGRRRVGPAGYAVRILDGNYLARTEHRPAVLRGTRAAALPGMSVVVLDPQARLAVDFFPSANAHTQERALLPDVLRAVRPRQLWIGDRNFCVASFLDGLRQRRAHYLIRQHASTISWEPVGRRTNAKRTDTGRVWEQRARLLNVAGQPVVRRVVLELDQPTRDGATFIAVLTTLPPRRASAVQVMTWYRQRWTVEHFFQTLTDGLRAEIDTLAYPGAALFAFAVALVASNVLAVVQAALAAEHGRATVEQELSDYWLAEEVSGIWRGLEIAVPDAWWERFGRLPAAALARWLRGVARGVDLRRYRKAPRGPKKPRPTPARAGRFRHVATAKLLAQKRHNKSP